MSDTTNASIAQAETRLRPVLDREPGDLPLSSVQAVLRDSLTLSRAWMSRPGPVPARARGKATLGQIVKRLREGKGLTAVQLAAAVGTTRQFVQKLESDKGGDPKFGVVCALADALGVKVEDLRA